MPARTVERKAVRVLGVAVAVALACSACAAPSTPPAAASSAAPAAPASAASAPAGKPPVANSGLTAPLFYQLLVGEMELRQGAPGAAYDVLLDAARKTQDEQLFRRATDIALQARAGEQALAAARAWRDALPASAEANRYLMQILVVLNRPADAAEPTRALIALTPPADRAGLIAAVPRLYARATDTRASAAAIEEALGPSLQDAATRTVATVSVGRGWLAAADKERALEAARRAAAAEPASDVVALFALELLTAEPAAEPLVAQYLQAVPRNDAIRLVYARVLAGLQRYPDAIAQFETLTQRAPSEPAPWLSLGALRLELKEPRAAQAALETYVRLAQAAPAPSPARGAPAGTGPDDGGDDAVVLAADGLTQAYLMLAQAAEQQGDVAAAERWLGRIDSPQRALDVQSRRASLRVKQGRVDEARALIRAVPEASPQDARAKLLAEAQVLRDGKRWADARAVLRQAVERTPDDADLLYEEAMVAEKQNDLDGMEQLLRRVIDLKPDHQHAYNALGYSLADRNQRLPEARALIRKALDLAPGEPFITDSLGWVEYRLGNRDEAVRLLRQAYRARPDVEIAAHLGEVLWVSGQRDEARSVWREATARDAANEVLRETLARLRVDL